MIRFRQEEGTPMQFQHNNLGSKKEEHVTIQGRKEEEHATTQVNIPLQNNLAKASSTQTKLPGLRL